MESNPSSENETNTEHNEELLELPGSAHAKIPLFLKITYVFLPLWGLLWLYLYWNGSSGALDGGSWQGLQEAANTTYVEDQKN